MKNLEKLEKARFGGALPLFGEGDLENYLKQRAKVELSENNTQHWKMFAIVFARPAVALAKEYVIPNLEFLHDLSSDHIDFYFVGYQLADQTQGGEIVSVGQGNWVYKNFDFVRLTKHFEASINWKYSGRTDIILANYTLLNGEIVIDYSGAIAMKLENAIECKAINSIEEFMKKLADYSATYSGSNPALDFTKSSYIEVARKTFGAYLLHLLPEWLRKTPQQLDTFLLVDLRKYQ